MPAETVETYTFKPETQSIFSPSEDEEKKKSG
jgi:hypothetical protein